MADLYNEKIMDHFTKPRNVGVMKDADGIGEVGNPTCGDIMKIYIKVATKPQASGVKKKAPDSKDKKQKIEYIEDIKFQTLGCGAAIATSSMVTEMAIGKSLKEAEEITNRQVADELGGLPPIKMHCSNLAASALKKAIEDYKNK
ncbi:iron-sulfur cluster assembly scaffold protein [Patescibacteria group bacterium]|nr:iron-sulfur cluster assembly scaffold protein [Patescibacteria group bacterium]